MTENNDFNNTENDSTISRNEKRFKLFVGNHYGIKSMDGEVIIDSIISIGDADVLVDWLNALYDENEQLKQQLKTKVIVNKQYEELQRLKQENEEFKKALMELKEIGDYQEGRIKELNDENEQLKQVVEEFIENKTQHNLWKLRTILKELKGDLE